MDSLPEQGSYLEQLREVFNSCDVKRVGNLGETELLALCDQLQLTEQASDLVHHLLKKNAKSRVDFEQFKEGFIALLTQSNEIDSGNEYENENSEVFQSSKREVSPKFVLGAKKYGRRSRPASLIEGDECLSTGDLWDSQEVFKTPQSTIKDGELVRNLFSLPPMLEVFETPPRTDKGLKKSHSEPSGAVSEMIVSSSSTPPQSPLYQSRNSSFQSDSENCLWSAPEEFLVTLWKRLGMDRGKGLNVEELASVCSHIGMETTKETVSQLFDKLDCDRDGRVTFEELLQGLFQHGIPEGSKSPVTSEMSFTCSPVNHRTFRHSSQEEMQISEPSIETGIFSSIDPDKGGYVSASSIVDLWESLGLPCGLQLLQDLGFNVKLKINLQDLTLILEEEMNNASSDHVYQVALSTLQHEIRHNKTLANQLLIERDKLKEAVAESNDRAAMMAQEIDEGHAKLEEVNRTKIVSLERRFQEQLRELQEELRKERDGLTNQMATLKNKLEKELAASQMEEGNLRMELENQQTENARLEKEVQEVLNRFSDAEERNFVLQKEVDALSGVRQKLTELEARPDEEQLQTITLELEELRKQNKDLLDHTMELKLEMDNLRQTLNSNHLRTSNAKKRHNRTSSWLSDYHKGGYGDVSNSSCGLKRRGSESSSDGNSEEESRMIGKVRRRIPVSKVSMQESYEVELMEEPNLDFKVPDFKNADLEIDDLAKKLKEEVALKNQEIDRKEQAIVSMKEEYENLLSTEKEKFTKETERCRRLEKTADETRAEIRVTVSELYELVEGCLPSNGVAGKVPLQSTRRKIEDNFSSILRLVQEPSSKLIDESQRRGNGKETLPTPVDTLLRDLYVENGRLMKELKMSEELRIKAEQGNMMLKTKCKMLGNVISEVTHSSLK